MTANADKFFVAHTARAIDAARRDARRAILIVAVFLTIVVLLLGGALYAVTLRPLTVIDHCPGASSSGTAELSDIAVASFMSRFIELYSAQSPDAALTIADAYNLMTPRLQQVLSAERADAGRAVKWQDKNIRSDLFMENVSMDRVRGEGRPFAAQALARLIFRPAVGFGGDYRPFEASSLWTYIQFSLVPVPVTEKTPSGLLVDFYQIHYFNDEELRKAFLLKRNILFGERP